MTSVLKLPHLWRTLKEADLAAIRRDAERRFEVLVVAEDGGDAERLAQMLTGADREHPWLTLATPDQARDRSAAAGLDAAILVSPGEDLPPSLAAVFGREPDHTHSYYVRPGFPDADALFAAIRDLDYAWYQDGMPSTNFARAEAEARP